MLKTALVVAALAGLQYTLLPRSWAVEEEGGAIKLPFGYKLDVSWANIRRVLFEEKQEADLVEAVSLHNPARQAVQPDDYDEAIQTSTPVEASPSKGTKHAERTHNECRDTLFPQSSYTTKCLEITAISSYRGRVRRDEHRWSYKVTFTNNGDDTLQMLARHWIFTDSNGATQEVKGPGARGDTPIISPGESWSYESGAQLATPVGSMSGSFHIEVLKHGGFGSSCSAYPDEFFSARVARLALTGFEEEPLKVPCGDPAKNGLVPTTSVHSSKRVIVGVTVEHVGVQRPSAGDVDDEDSDDTSGNSASATSAEVKAKKHIYRYDVQINNARTMPIKVEAFSWRIRTLRGEIVQEEMIEGEGLGGFHQIPPRIIEDGDAFRWLGLLLIDGEEGMLDGHFLVNTEEGTIRAKIAEMAMTKDGKPIEPSKYLSSTDGE